MRRIFKYTIPVETTRNQAHQIEIPKDSLFLKAENQKEKLVLWYEVDETKEVEIVGFMCLHTGDYIPANPSVYLSTILFDNGDYVLHLYQL